MQINNAHTLSALLDSGAVMRLDSAGTLHTHSKIGQFWQRLCDTFRSADTIARRNDRLDTAIAQMLSQDQPVQNPVFAPVDSPKKIDSQQTALGYVDQMVASLMPDMDASIHQNVSSMIKEQIQNDPAIQKMFTDTGGDLEKIRSSLSGMVKEYQSAVLTEKTRENQTQFKPASPPQPAQKVVSEGEIQRMLTTSQSIIKDVLGDADARLQTYVEKNLTEYLRHGEGRFLHGTDDKISEALTDKILKLADEFHTGGPVPTKVLHGPEKTEDIQPNCIFRQGHDTCFMMSVINSMMTNPQGRAMMENILALDNCVIINGQDYPMLPAQDNFSSLERTLGAIYKQRDPGWQIGQQGFAVDFGQMLGLEPINDMETGRSINVQISSDNAGAPALRELKENARQALDQHMLPILFSGSTSGGHYMAVVDTYEDKGGGLVVHDSISGTARRIPLAHLNVFGSGITSLEVMKYPDN